MLLLVDGPMCPGTVRALAPALVDAAYPPEWEVADAQGLANITTR
jgi:hypothetical protein